MSALAFKGTSLDQDPRWQKNMAKRKKNTKFPEIFATKVDLNKVNREQMKKWAAQKLVELFEGLEDEVLINYVGAYLDQPSIDPEEMQLSLSDMLERDAASFMEELWNLLVDAQNQPIGIPRALLEATKASVDARLQERGRIAEGMGQQRYGLQAVRHHIPLPPNNSNTDRSDYSRGEHRRSYDERSEDRGQRGYRPRRDGYDEQYRSNQRQNRGHNGGHNSVRYQSSPEDERDRRSDEDQRGPSYATRNNVVGDERQPTPRQDRRDSRDRDFGDDGDDRRDSRAWRRDRGDRGDRGHDGDDRRYQRRGQYRDEEGYERRNRRDERPDRSSEQDPFGRDARPSKRDQDDSGTPSDSLRGNSQSNISEDGTSTKKRLREDSTDSDSAPPKKAKLGE